MQMDFFLNSFCVEQDEVATEEENADLDKSHLMPAAGPAAE